MYQTINIVIKEHHPLKQVFEEYTHLAKLFKNTVTYRYRQLLFAKYKDFENLSEEQQKVIYEFKDIKPITKKHYFPSYETMNKMFRATKNEDYFNKLPSQCTQQIIKEVRSNFEAYFSAKRAYFENPSLFTGMPKIPKYCKSSTTSFDITSQESRIRKNKKTGNYELKIPKTDYKLSLGKLNIPNLKEVTVKPFYNTYKVCIVYEIEDKDIPKLNSSRILGIDLGVNNFLTTSNNVGLRPFIINGKIIKSVNQKFNKDIAYYKSLLREGQYASKRLEQIYKYRNNYFNDFIHKATHHVLEYCKTNNIDTIVVGKNNYWKQNSNIGKRNNQNFIMIPHALFIKKLEEKAIKYGVNVLVQEESYSSKASFLDKDELPTFSKENKGTYKFSGKRIYRGLYQTKEGILINADVNGASNIIRKAFPDAFKFILEYKYLYVSTDKITIDKKEKVPKPNIHHKFAIPNKVKRDKTAKLEAKKHYIEEYYKNKAKN